MSDDIQAPKARATNYLILALAIIAIGAGIYFIMQPAGNEGVASACRDAGTRSARLEPFAHGDMAGLILQDQPKLLADLSFLDGAGEPVELSQFAGKSVLLNLWATWCAPCRHEMPALNALERELGSADFQVVAVSIDLGEPHKPKKFFAEVGLDAMAFFHDGSMDVFSDLKSMGMATGMPTTILVDANNCALAILNGPAEWASKDAIALIHAAIAANQSG